MARTQSYPLISVVVPVYNAEKFLHICLEYLVHQTYPNLEFIIVDDGSTDNTPEIYKNYAKQKIQNNTSGQFWTSQRKEQWFGLRKWRIYSLSRQR